MADPDITPIPPTEAFPASGRRSRTTAFVSWFVILGIVTLAVYSNARRSRNGGEGDAGGDVRLRLMAQQAIGFRGFEAMAGLQGEDRLKENRRRLVREMETLANSAVDKLRVAIVAGEILDTNEVLSRLDQLSRERPSAELSDDIDTLRQIYTAGVTSINSQDRERLLGKHGYFAEVALSQGVERGTEPRRSMESTATRMALRVGAIALAMLLLMALSAALFIAAIVFVVKKWYRPVYSPDSSTGSAYLEAFALYLLLFMLLGIGLRLLGLSSLQWQWLGWLILPVIFFWISRRGNTGRTAHEALGWHRGRGWLQEIAAGLAGYIAGLVPIGVSLLVTLVLIRRSGASPEHPILHALNGNWLSVLGLYAVACVFAPVLEETMFRGVLFHHLRGRWSWMTSAGLVAFIFAIIHPQGWTTVPVLGSIAMVLAAIREWRGSILAPIAAHACNNFIALTIALILLRD